MKLDKVELLTNVSLISLFYTIHYVLIKEFLLPASNFIYRYSLEKYNILTLYYFKDISKASEFLLIITFSVFLILIGLYLYNFLKIQRNYERFHYTEFIGSMLLFNMWFGKNLFYELFSITDINISENKTYLEVCAQLYLMIAFMICFVLSYFLAYDKRLLFLPNWARKTLVIVIIPLIINICKYANFYRYYKNISFYHLIPYFIFWFRGSELLLRVRGYSNIQIVLQMFMISISEMFFYVQEIFRDSCVLMQILSINVNNPEMPIFE